ncbi:SufE family protein [Algihabitans albus]|uniref:SufE family protein n=1 Tax=Algihabitans albus TaxID=2164067 RepID=UPI000E5CF4B8|nr:SufE family protein [Algihabitans albus]
MSEQSVTDPRLDELAETFEFFEDWEDRYRYIIDLGKELTPLGDAEKAPEFKVEGCVSQVWLLAGEDPERTGALQFRGDSDAHIVKGLVAVLLTLFNGRTPQEILEFDARGALDRLDLAGHLSPSRSNGLFSMVRRIRALAAARAGQAETTLH